MSKSKLLIMILALMMLVAGCGTKKVQETKEPQVGVVDIKKAVQSHPKYNQLLSLEQEARKMAAQAEAQQAAMVPQGTLALPETSQGDLAEMNKAFQQQFTEKMSVKEKEINARLAAKENSVHQTLAEELKTYADGLDKEYQPQIFNLQLKLKTVQLTKEEAASLQEQLQSLQVQYADKMSQKQNQLSAQMNEKMAPDKAAAAQELKDYSKVVNEEISKQAAVKQGEIAARNAQITPPAVDKQDNDRIGQQLTMKQQEIQALQNSIIQDIKDKTGKIGIESGFEAVLTNVIINVNGVDITNAVIAECNK